MVENLEQLIEESVKAKDNSYSPYSNFRVGCSLLMNDGHYITGANIENVGQTGSCCAERSAIFRALSSGYKAKESIKALAVNADTSNFITPCGVCRQVMIELVEPNTPVYLTNVEKEYKKTTVSELLPGAFNSLGK